MKCLPPPDFADRGHDLRLDPPAGVPLVPGIYHLTQGKQGISSIELGRRLGVTQTTACKIKHKLAQAMTERDAAKPLKGGGERSGGKRVRGAPDKTPFVAAVETTPEGKPVRLNLRRVSGFSIRALSDFAKRSLDPKCEVVSDGLACFGAVADAGCAHTVTKTGSGAAAARIPTFKWANAALWNIKAAIVGTYRAIDQKHVPRYLAEFEYRFNRRYDLAAMMPRLTWSSVRTGCSNWLMSLHEQIHTGSQILAEEST